MGSYSFDTIFRVLKLEAPASVEASSTDRYDETYPLASIVRFHFAPRPDMPAVDFSWFDGGLRPTTPEELDRKSTRLNSSHGYISYAVFCLKKKKMMITACIIIITVL